MFVDCVCETVLSVWGLAHPGTNLTHFRYHGEHPLSHPVPLTQLTELLRESAFPMAPE